MKIPNWGAFKGTYHGHGIYWGGDTPGYNVEGYGSFRTIAEARRYIDELNQSRADKEKDSALAKVAAGDAILCERKGDTVTIHLPTGKIELPIRVYRQNVFTWETQYGKEFVWA